jgi:aquaglyceroporin related protein
MRRGRGNEGVLEDKAAEIEEPGNAEPIPQVGLIDDQRLDACKDPKQTLERQTEQRGYGHQRENLKHYSKRQPSARSGHLSIHSENRQRSFGRYGSPKEEKENPMDTWSAEQQLPDILDPFDGAESDVGDQRLHRLSGVKEESLSRHNSASTESIASDVDLEAGEKIDDWPVEDEEAEHYILEERENYNAWASIRARFREPLAECLAVRCSPPHPVLPLTISRL